MAGGRAMKIEGDSVIFSTGNTFYANNGVIGLAPFEPKEEPGKCNGRLTGRDVCRAI